MQINTNHTKYNTLVCGGTFDSLHEGHKAFLRYAFSLSKHVYVAITSDLYTKKHKPLSSAFLKREREVGLFLKAEGLFDRAHVVSIDNIFGITRDTEFPIEAILVTKDTLLGAEKVNKKRKELGLSELSIEVMPRILTETGIPISSTNIRNGIFDSTGKLLVKKEIIQNISYMPYEIRTILHKPFGELVTKEELKKIDGERLIAVGDVTTQILHENGFSPSLCVIDFVIERKKQNTTLREMGFTGREQILRAVNPPSTITPQLWNSISRAFAKIKNGSNVCIIVNGEEDLAVLPILILSPFGYVIFYGQPSSGMIQILINEEVKNKALELINKFKSKDY